MAPPAALREEPGSLARGRPQFIHYPPVHRPFWTPDLGGDGHIPHILLTFG